jgi:hypothetical protein
VYNGIRIFLVLQSYDERQSFDIKNNTSKRANKNKIKIIKNQKDYSKHICPSNSPYDIQYLFCACQCGHLLRALLLPDPYSYTIEYSNTCSFSGKRR